MAMRSPSRRMPLKPSMSCRSTRCSGVASLSFIIGVRLWPPALGKAGPVHWRPMRDRAVDADNGAVAFLADEDHMRERHDVAAMDPKEERGIELRLGFRNRPGGHAFAGAVVDLRVMRVGPDAPD